MAACGNVRCHRCGAFWLNEDADIVSDTLPAKEGFHSPGDGGRGGGGGAASHGNDGVLGRVDDGIRGCAGDGTVHHGVN